jgi:hypothetical protein
MVPSPGALMTRMHPPLWRTTPCNAVGASVIGIVGECGEERPEQEVVGRNALEHRPIIRA